MTSTLGASKVVFWVMILITQVHAFVGALPYIPFMVMWGKFTPKSEMLGGVDMLISILLSQQTCNSASYYHICLRPTSNQSIIIHSQGK